MKIENLIDMEEIDVNIKIIDSPMGFGKTSYLIQMINEDIDNNKYMYITPFLDEVDRIEINCKNKKFYQPNNKAKNGSKLESLKKLISQGKNIVSTHALFSMADEELIMLIKSEGYILILDEVMDVVEQVAIKKDDINMLLEQEIIEIQEEPYNKVVWLKDNYDGKFNDVKTMAYNESLYYVNNTLMIWTMPVNAFKSFTEIYISTYLFDSQIQKYYYDYFNIKYTYYHIEKENDKYLLIKTTDFNYDKDFKLQAKQLINIIDNPKLNAVGDYIGKSKSALSKSWYIKYKDEEVMKTLSKNLLNFFRRYCVDKSELHMWTTFKEYKSTLKGKGFTKGFVPCNSRATNQYSNKTNCAYVLNRYLNPFYKNFFNQRNIEIDEDKFALSEMLQWIWRSAIRNNESINLYIPSERMRSLLIDFMNSTSKI